MILQKFLPPPKCSYTLDIQTSSRFGMTETLKICQKKHRSLTSGGIPSLKLTVLSSHLKIFQVGSDVFPFGKPLTLPKTNSSPLKIGLPKRKVVSQPPFFRGYVSFREGLFPWMSQDNLDLYLKLGRRGAGDFRCVFV